MLHQYCHKGITHNMNSMAVRSDVNKEDIKQFCKSIVGVQFHGETSNHHNNKVSFLWPYSCHRSVVIFFKKSLYDESHCE